MEADPRPPRARSGLRARLRPWLPLAWRSYRHMREAESGYRRFLRGAGVAFEPVEPGPAPGGRVSSVTGGVWPPRRQRHRAEKFEFFRLGYHLLPQLLGGLEAASLPLADVHSLLELGCGTARYLRLLRGIEGLRLVGTDVDAESIAWCRRRVPGPEYHVNELHPPLRFARDGEFDVVLAAAVFTHIAPRDQRPWLDEVRRVLRPGGALLCTVLGEGARQSLLGEPERRALARDGELVLGRDHPLASATASLVGLCDTFFTPQRSAEIYGAAFELRAVRPLGAQDLLVLVRPAT